MAEKVVYDDIYKKNIAEFDIIFEKFKRHTGFSNSILDIIEQFSKPKAYIFGTMYSSTLTAQGSLSNVEFEEKDLIYTVNAIGRIKKITCNYGEVYNKDFKEVVLRKKQTNRGRKPKVKPRNVRKNQGNGKYFNSQITFWVQSLTTMSKYYKIKLFRNGTIEIPGGLEPSMNDIWSAVHVVRDEIADCLITDVHIVELYSIMRNYKFITIDTTSRINISMLYNIFIKAHEKKCPGVHNITEIKYNIERYPGLIIKFSTPITRNPLKQTTIKMFQSGKVNIDGAISEECAAYYYNWINDFYISHAKEIIYVPNSVVIYSDSDSDSDNPGDTLHNIHDSDTD
jgi:TATA-box binding protein (TBP) (component of TFIID and TFIIIB)